MKKKLLFLLFFSTLPLFVFAQWGIKGGVDFSTFTGFSSAEYKTGFHVGGTYDVAISRKFYFQPGLLFVLNGTKFKTDIDLLKLDTKADISIYGLEVPLNFSFRHKVGNQMKLVVDFGLYARYGLFGTYTFESEGSITEESPFDDYNRFDMGLNLGLGLEYKSYYLGGAYQIGFTDAEKEIMTQHQVFRISLGYRF